MKRRIVGGLLLASACAFPLALRAGQDPGPQGPLALTGVVLVPGNPILSADIGWVDPGGQRYYIADRSNSGVDIVDAATDLFVGRVGGMAGPLGSGGGTATTNGGGPNGVLVTPDGVLWAGDGNSTTTVADVDPGSATYLMKIGSINTAISACDGGTATTHYCGRDDELGYDPVDRVILIANNAPLNVAAPHGAIDPYATFIAADPPYPILGTLSFPGAGGLEQPLWDPNLNGGRFLLTVPGKTAGSPPVVVTPPTVAVIDPVNMTVERTISFDCEGLTGTVGASITGIALGQNQRILVSVCNFPVTLDASTGELFAINREIGGGDEVWYNPGDDSFYVTGADLATPGPTSLGAINGTSGNLVEILRDVRGKNPAANPQNNHVFTVVTINQAIVDHPETDDSTCMLFGFRGRGCIAVFSRSAASAAAHHAR